MFHLYWSQQVLAANAQAMAQMCNLWAAGWNGMAEQLGRSGSEEHWLSSVHARRNNWSPAVSNCAAGAYSAWGLDLSRRVAANEARYRDGRQKA
ncbi:hypothetical protein [Alkalilimnicola sp. S0819]|uniref:hypothetical protein n=1 Tax=Alkalilimnicola sp. S0819 TaxID=2613922 RepID=UPI00126276D4|nr:hypothetical protein [Alkalilimnicola sp. S0819]KAB7623626.1 hypothetical protein F3N43_08880 [Alkalilimnicola sp. S0819]MPQ16750.1 hypothetical protein [Alkalilimnicola sp. S0819]